MAATRTFDPGIAFDDTTLTPAANATGVLLDQAGGTVQQVYNLQGAPLANLKTNDKGYIGRFKAGIDFGVLSFGSVLQPVVSIEALQSGPAAAAAATSAANAAAAASNASSSASSAASAAASSASAAQAAALSASQAGSGGSGGIPAGSTLDSIQDSTNRLAMTAGERTKLAGVANNATALTVGTGSNQAMAGNRVFSASEVGAVANAGGAARMWYRTAAQGLPTPGSQSQDGDICLLDAS